jgi:hypothetical protein
MTFPLVSLGVAIVLGGLIWLNVTTPEYPDVVKGSAADWTAR